MKNFKYVLSIDPSGSFTEGKGITGWSLLNAETNQFICTGVYVAKDFHSAYQYYAHILESMRLILKNYKSIIVVIEDYMLYRDKTESQINSRMETCKLIGVLQQYLGDWKIPYRMQLAKDVVNRWNDDILLHKGYLVKQGNHYYTTCGDKAIIHTRDSMRHGIHFNTFYNEDEKARKKK